MFEPRTQEIENAKDLPSILTGKLEEVISSLYFENNKENDYGFKVVGKILPKELLLVVGHQHQEDHTLPAKTLYLSCDLENEDQLKKKFDFMCNQTDFFFHQLLVIGEDIPYTGINWITEKAEGEEIHYRFTRENLAVTIQTEELLNQVGFSN